MLPPLEILANPSASVQDPDSTARDFPAYGWPEGGVHTPRTRMAVPRGSPPAPHTHTYSTFMRVVPFNNIKFGGVLQFSQVNWAEVQRSLIEFNQVVTSCHQTFVVDAMPDAEKMTDLMGKHLDTAV